jgi:apolipoprotein N-acyltransferase
MTFVATPALHCGWVHSSIGGTHPRIAAGEVQRGPRIRTRGPAADLRQASHAAPPFESKFKPGTNLTFLREPSESWGVAICKDMDFAPLSRQYGKAGAGLLLVPAWDFVLDRWQHGHIAIMRGVEDGFSIVRAAKQGYLTVSDDRGHILAETQSDSAPFATLMANVPAAHETTVYLLLGDWSAWVALATLVFTLLQLYRSKNPLTDKNIAASRHFNG